MTYTTHTDGELLRCGIREGEIAIYTGTPRPGRPGSIDTNSYSCSAYVFRWEDGAAKELYQEFSKDSGGYDVLELEDEGYAFLRDKDSGYIRQFCGPVAPIVVANLGAITLRVDTFMGKYAVPAGTIQRLDRDTPRRERKKVCLVLDGRERAVISAELWDGDGWNKLNIRQEGNGYDSPAGTTVLDGQTVVQTVWEMEDGGLLFLDSPEPDPDYEICIAMRNGSGQLYFQRADYCGGCAVQRKRWIMSTVFDDEAYDLQKLKETLTTEMVEQCKVQLPAPEGIFERQSSVNLSDFDETLTSPDEFDDKEESEPKGQADLHVLLPKVKDLLPVEPQKEETGGDTALLADIFLPSLQDDREPPRPEPPEGFPA